MLDDFIRRNHIQLINIILCVTMIVAEIWAMTIIEFEWQLLVILLPFPIFILGNILSILINKKNINMMVNIMKIIFPILVLQTGLITFIKMITDTRMVEVTNKMETWCDFITIMTMAVSILIIILMMVLALSKTEGDDIKVKRGSNSL
ncbi:hypothetical protein [Staphylococcus pseudoxylosus]|uniref:hypothetical protein n=1 Tax=Staphylococcus pseudoxylosus TaxID=2282419 RepID=UPI002DB55C07|nr:hypothetical protein [Staphylococcus pseudoxylosus]MEB6038204.1 hypothetical protein [Staphylococcus pseudoxylosus]